MRMEDTWSGVDAYLEACLLPEDPLLDAVDRDCAAQGLPPHGVSPSQGRFLALLIGLTGARRVLEIGTLGGYSALWMARALPADGHLVTLEVDPHHAQVARGNIARAGLEGRIEVRLGAATERLAGLVAEGGEPFDLIFIDADKPNNPEYFRRSLQLSRPGTVIIADNVIREGAVMDGTSVDPKVLGVRRFLDMVAAEPRVSATALQTVGRKGYDGFALVRVEA
jgi:predicted O-methyltransferase YrrM